MNLTEIFPLVALSTRDLCALLPLVTLAVSAVLILLVTRFKESSVRTAGLGIFVIGSLVAMILLLGKCPTEMSSVSGATPVNSLGGVFLVDALSQFFTAMIIVATLCVGLISSQFIKRESMTVEYFSLLLMGSIGAILLVSTEDLLTVFIGLELMSLATYVLVAMRRTSSAPAEAGLKYFITGGVASAVFLYGASILFGMSGSMNVRMISESYMQIQSGALSPLTTIGALMVAVGVLFKLGAVPFHTWVPDVYSGASTPVTAFMMTTVKIAGFGMLLRVGEYVFASSGLLAGNSVFYLLLWLATALSLMWGAFAGALQRDLKRMLAYSTITHTGFILLGIFTYTGAFSRAYGPICNYLIVYSIMNLGLFSLLTMLSKSGDQNLELKDLTGLFRKSPMFAVSLSLFLLSLAGIPPAAGFFGKFFLINESVHAGEYLLACLGVLASILSVYYYMRPMVYIFSSGDVPESEVIVADRNNCLPWIMVLVAAVLTLGFGVMPFRF